MVGSQPRRRDATATVTASSGASVGKGRVEGRGRIVMHYWDSRVKRACAAADSQGGGISGPPTLLVAARKPVSMPSAPRLDIFVLSLFGF